MSKFPVHGHAMAGDVGPGCPQEIIMNAVRQPIMQSTKRLEKALNERDRYRALFEMGPIAVYS